VLLTHHLIEGTRAHPHGKGAPRTLERATGTGRAAEAADTGAGKVVLVVVGVETE
jgi:hypothetical protein